LRVLNVYCYHLLLLFPLFLLISKVLAAYLNLGAF
jgi:hypothetical protein